MDDFINELENRETERREVADAAQELEPQQRCARSETTECASATLSFVTTIALFARFGARSAWDGTRFWLPVVNPGETKIVYTGRMEIAAAAQLMTGVAATVPASAEDLEAALRLYKPKIFRFILASLRDKDAAESLTQDCFLRAYQFRERFRGECSLDTWLMQIAVNLVRDHARNQRLRFWRRAEKTGPRVEDLGDTLAGGDRSPEVRAVLREQVEAVWTAAQSLPERQRSVFLLRFVEDMDLSEIAAVTGMKEGTVKTHLFRALKNVRERIGAWKTAGI